MIAIGGLVLYVPLPVTTEVSVSPPDVLITMIVRLIILFVKTLVLVSPNVPGVVLTKIVMLGLVLCVTPLKRSACILPASTTLIALLYLLLLVKILV